MIIRKAKMEDTKELNLMLTLLIRDEKKYDDSIDETFVVTNMYENYIEDSQKCILVAEEDNKVVGYLYGILKTEDEVTKNKKAILDALYVDTEYRKSGIASSLIKSFKKWCSNNGVKSIEVSVCSKNTTAKKLYDKHKFETFRETMKIDIKL